jgi:aminoglycoside phosphotransferase (APT) family kinase protein
VDVPSPPGVLDEDVDQFVSRAIASGRVTNGHHNRNHVLALTGPLARRFGRAPGTRVTVRMRRTDALPVVIRTWHEWTILAALRGTLPHVPECLHTQRGLAVHSYVEGVPLSSVCGNGKPVDTLLMRALVRLLAEMTQVRPSALPSLPAAWPTDHTDSRGFLRTLAHMADRQIRRPNRPAFGGLFAALGIHDDALFRFAERVPRMTPRPYSLLHADLHRDNLIVTYNGDPPLICVDWELATYGDPLHDLATHLVRMRYPAHQWDEVVDAWAQSMARTRPAAVLGLARDLRHYVAFERAQSVYPDVMRAARSLEAEGADDQKSLDAATAAVHRALRAAAEPLRLFRIPDAIEIERILVRWFAGKRGVLARREGAWRPDQRFPEHPGFSRDAVRRALLAEGAAPAGTVFRETSHLNSLVRVPGFPSPVVVRRALPNARRIEPDHLSEHAVLRAIETSWVAVAAPRLLALGQDESGDGFSILTYEGPSGMVPPEHPVEGLRPYEADALIDQLAALTRVDCPLADPTAGEGAFHRWLIRRLIWLVQNLPRETRQLAQNLGLPNAQCLGQILDRHEVGPRRLSLLHGDLGPWNLIRRDDDLALSLVGWEQALVGDPLYDLVRHLHLTPTRPEIRDRMVRRWERVLPVGHSLGWQRDWQVYRQLEIVRSAYVDLDRMVTGSDLDIPDVGRAVDSYAMTFAAAAGVLGMRVRTPVNPYLTRALS